MYTIYDVWCMLFHISVTAEGKKIPTELKGEASQLRKKMKFDDTEREGTLYVLCRYCQEYYCNRQMRESIVC